MDQQDIAREVADLVIRDTGFWIAIVGLVGTIVGAATAVGGSVIVHRLQTRRKNALDASRTKLLDQMLELRDWRKLSTLSSVIGADDETTRRLLVELGARGSERRREDEDEVWGLIRKHPLERIE